MKKIAAKKPVQASKNNDKNTAIYIGVALLLGGGIMYAKGKNKDSSDAAMVNPVKSTNNTAPSDSTGTIDTAPKPIAIYITKILKIGSKGLEVQKLQALMKISADGFFGPQTEAMLYRLKGVKQITLDQYNKTGVINRDVLAATTKVQSPLANGTIIYDAIRKAGGTYYSTMKAMKTVPYGQAIGVIRTASSEGNWYTVFYEHRIGGEFWPGQNIGFVKATDVESYK